MNGDHHSANPTADRLLRIGSAIDEGLALKTVQGARCANILRDMLVGVIRDTHLKVEYICRRRTSIKPVAGSQKNVDMAACVCVSTVSLQLVFIRSHDLAAYQQTRLMPGEGAFIEDASVPVGCDVEELRAALLPRLEASEGYRAAVRGLAPRACTPGAVFVELQDGRMVRLQGADSGLVECPARIAPASSWVANLPPETAGDLKAMRESRVPHRIRRMFAVVEGW